MKRIIAMFACIVLGIFSTIMYITLLVSIHNSIPTIPTYIAPVHDQRVGILSDFMDTKKFTNKQDIHAILLCADRYNINWRLLPAIELKESSGGKRYIRSTHNPFGWGSDTIGFKTDKEAICTISSNLANGSHYKGKSIEEKLTSYNNDSYAKEVIQIMKIIKETK